MGYKLSQRSSLGETFLKHHRLKISCVFVAFFNTVLISWASTESIGTCAKNLKAPVIHLIVPDFVDSHFWSNYVNLTKIASKQYEIDLNVYYIDRLERSRFNFANKIEQIISTSKRPDYIISFFLSHSEKSIIALANKHQLKFFSINSPFSERVESTLGRPREKDSFWIGHISPDDQQVGYDVANFLLSNRDSFNEQLSLLAINGSRESEVAEMRSKGLIKRINETEDVSLLQIIYTDWSFQQGKEKVNKLLKRFNDIKLVWSASDVLTVAARQEFDLLDLDITQQPTFASIDWSPQIVPLLKNEKVAVSFGGHFFEGAWLLGLIFDHFNGLDFYNELGSVISYPLQPVTAGNSDLILSIEGKNFDFKQLSKCLTPAKKTYSFDAMLLLKNSIKPG